MYKNVDMPFLRCFEKYFAAFHITFRLFMVFCGGIHGEASLPWEA
jgi:hypothetical protein